MTPEKARELLDDATPGPWGLERIDGDMHIIFQGVPREPEEWDMPLIAAAPDLAAIVANLHYEYAVQVNDREWLRENDEGRFILTGDPMCAIRHYHPVIMAAIAKKASARFGCECRVVRRLVGDAEVIE